MDFQTLPVATLTNPLVYQRLEFEVRDESHKPYPDARIGTEDHFKGLRVGYQLEVRLTNLCSAVEVTLVQVEDLSEPATVMAFDAKRRQVGEASLPGHSGVTPQTLTVTGPHIDHIVIVAHNDTSLLLGICSQPESSLLGSSPIGVAKR